MVLLDARFREARDYRMSLSDDEYGVVRAKAQAAFFLGIEFAALVFVKLVQAVTKIQHTIRSGILYECLT